MKNLLLFILLISFAYSCTTFESFKRSDLRGAGIVINENSFVNNISEKGLETDGIYLNFRIGDTVRYDGYYYEDWYGKTANIHYIIDFKGKKYGLPSYNLISLIQYEFNNMRNPVCINPEDDKVYLGRAIKYITENSDMKIETINDYLIETYSPSDDFKVGFSINREYQFDGSICYSVKVRGGRAVNINTLKLLERRGLFYIKYGYNL